MPLNIDFQQILLHLLNFAILAGGLYFLLYKPVKQFMGKREAQYAEREAAVAKVEAKAEKLHAEYLERYRTADAEILRHREQVSEELENEKQRQLNEARAEARKIIATAKKTADLRTKKALEDSHKEIRDLAMGMVEKLVVTSDGDALDRFLDEAESEEGHG